MLRPSVGFEAFLVWPLMPALHAQSFSALSRRFGALRLPSLGGRNQFQKHSTWSAKVPVRGNGHIKLDILEPAASREGKNGDVIVYLTPGPLYDSHLAKPSVQVYSHNNQDNGFMLQRTLADNTASTVVTLHYRLGQVSQKVAGEKFDDEKSHGGRKTTRYFQFPTPIHDTLAAFDWVLENLQPRALGVAGARIGGSLSLMLALTEPRRVTATATISPIGNWAGLDDWCITEYAEREKLYSITSHGSAASPAELKPLLRTRERLFRKPDGYFDPFASPLLFLRSAGTNVPPKTPKYFTGPKYPIPRFKPRSKEDNHATDYAKADDEGWIFEDNDSRLEYLASYQKEVMTKPLIKRVGRFTKWWRSMDFQLPPYTRIYVPSANIAPLLATQGDHLADAMRMSCFERHEEGLAQERVRIEQLTAGQDPWGLSDQSTARSVGQFFSSVFSANRGSLPIR